MKKTCGIGSGIAHGIGRRGAEEEEGSIQKTTGDNRRGLRDQDQSQPFSSLLDDIVQAIGTSKISQSISVQEEDEFITLKSPGTSGKWVMKFDLYPYRSCVRNSKQDWWRHAEIRSTMVISGRDSPVGVMIEKLKKEIIKQMMSCKNVETERNILGSKRGWRNS